jgi:anaerobic ribonucleoside-triphosphate reductase
MDEKDLKDGKCPICGEKHIEKMCPLDRLCTCAHEITSGAHYCPECGAAICPCGSHDVEQISRVTGYLQTISGFNAAKKQEIKDRQRYDIG